MDTVQERESNHGKAILMSKDTVLVMYHMVLTRTAVTVPLPVIYGTIRVPYGTVIYSTVCPVLMIGNTVGIH